MISMKMIEANKSYGEVDIKCGRCMGEMVYEKFYGPHEHFWGWRCILCGEIIDPIIMENRLQVRSGLPTIVRARRR